MARARLKRISREREFLSAAELAHTIWREHYAGLLSSDQIEYMLERFQSAAAIKEADAQGCEYYLIRVLGLNIGYAALQPDHPQGKLFLSKAYLLKDYRGKGYFSSVIREACEMARAMRLKNIWLTVAKNNRSSIAVYEHLGFIHTEDICTDIGGGFVMDDYIMELTV